MSDVDAVVDTERISTSKVVTSVFEQVLAAVHEGTLLPGQRINDAELAERFGVSRTPVREALQRLREIGIIEASASRFTRVSDVTPIQTAQAFVVWLALFRPLVDEVVPVASTSLLRALEADHAAYVASLRDPSPDPQRIATANFDFFNRMVAESHNPALQRAITSVVHIVRLGSLRLPAYIDLGTLSRAQELLVEAVRGQDLNAARVAVGVIGSIEVPLT